MKKNEAKELIEVEQVKLRPLWNMNVATYLTIIYALVILIVLFVVGFLPGIINSGKRVTFMSSVESSAVYVDDAYIGTSPITTFLEPGEHSVTYSYKDIGSEQFTLEVSHPLFLTWLFPRKQEVSSSFYLGNSSIEKYLDSLLADIASYSAIIDYSESYHYPPLFTMAAKTVTSSPFESSSYLPYFFDGALFITSQTMLDDFSQAIEIFNAHGVDTSALESVGAKISLLFDDSQKGNTSVVPQNIDNVTSQKVTLSGDLSLDGYLYPQSTFAVGKSSTKTYPGVQEMGFTVSIEPFVMSAHEISEYQWALFIEENPMWSKSKIEELIAKNLVDELYLDGVYPTTAIVSSIPIRNISYYSAVAFTDWLSEKSGKEVSLPTNAQWELASKSTTSSFQSSLFLSQMGADGPKALLGGVWEFTSDEFIPLSRYLQQELQKNLTIDDIIVKGGSYLNQKDSIDSATIGVMNKSQCSDGTGFRVVWK